MAGQSAGVTPLTGPVTDLGLGTSLSQQRQTETDEERKKRMLGVSSIVPGVTSLLGMGASGRGY